MYRKHTIGMRLNMTNTPKPPNNREWRILSSVRHPHICGLVDRTRYENPRVRCTKLVMEIMDTSLQVRFRLLIGLGCDVCVWSGIDRMVPVIPWL